ncbi:hypothetical protein Scep_016805 [Stephania cephalantha]|uniref:Uncharacterized protein n=1 Tax=Stephania cephalantha TaxID=152367 RepID=A0AAP0IQB3_9MAGN
MWRRRLSYVTLDRHSPPKIISNNDNVDLDYVVLKPFSCSAVGPESPAFDCDGEGPYTGISDGRIFKWDNANHAWVEFAVSSGNSDVSPSALAGLRAKGRYKKEHLFVGLHDLPEGPAEAPVYGNCPKDLAYIPHPPRFEPTPSRDKGVGSWSRVPSRANARGKTIYCCKF